MSACWDIRRINADLRISVVADAIVGYFLVECRCFVDGCMLILCHHDVCFLFSFSFSAHERAEFGHEALPSV